MWLQIFLDIIFDFAIYLLVSISYSIIYGATKFFHLAHAAVITIAAYVVCLLLIYRFPLVIPFAVIVGILAATIIGFFCELLIYRPMRNNNLPSLSYLIASIGLYIVLQNAVSLCCGDDTKTIKTAEITAGHQIYDAYITTVQIIAICVSFALFTAVNLFLHFTAIGKSIRAVSSNPELCNIYGISSNKIILIAFYFGSALAAVAGILAAMDTHMTPTFGFNLLLYGVVAMIIGGVGSIRGLLAGSLLVATAQHLTAFYLDTKWMDAVTYIILILFLIWKPLGFSGKRLKKVEV